MRCMVNSFHCILIRPFMDVTYRVLVSCITKTLVRILTTTCIGIFRTVRIFYAQTTILSLISKLALAYWLSHIGPCKDTCPLTLCACWHTFWLVTKWSSVICLADTTMWCLFGWIVWVFAVSSNWTATLQWNTIRAVGTCPTRVTFAYTRFNAMSMYTIITNGNIAKSS